MPFGIDIFRTTERSGQEVIVGLSWDILLVFSFIATAIFLIHFILRELWNPTDHTESYVSESKEEVQENLESQGVDEVQRFTMAQRASHWIMAISIFLLLFSGFAIMNTATTIKLIPGVSWLTIHIVAAIVLIGYVLFHVGHVAYKGTWGEMWFGLRDVKDLWLRFKNLIGMTDEYPRQFKYPSAQKFLHWSVTAASLGVILTGFVLLRRVNLQPLWSATREFTFLGVKFGLGTSDAAGLVSWSFVLHDLFAVSIFALIIGHVYFALRPNEWPITQSMITGRVPVEHYAEKYSPESWTVGGTTSPDGGEEEDDAD
ncbi:MAG: cytochrome b/b6 domain-containing protein [Halobacteriaceae archaeon]